MDFSVRRSIADDAPFITRLVAEDDFIHRKRFGAKFNVHQFIETNYLSVTVLDAHDKVVGFASFDDSPPKHVNIPRTTWHEFLHCGWVKADEVKSVHSSNAVWLTFIATASAHEFEITMQILTTALATIVQADYVLMALTDDVPPFSPVCDIFSPFSETGPHVPPENKIYHATPFKGRVYKAHRSEIIPELVLRVGVVEDYDDLMPLLASGEGIVTPLPENLFLEELLQDQDEHHAVVVGLDRTTNRVVGLMCLRATYDEQQHVVKQYATDHYQKLKPILPQTTHRGQQQGHNVVHISFFYLNPQYDSCAKQFVPHAFGMFPFAEYCMMYLPHAAPVHPVLHDFTYIPIKKLQPSNVQGERLPLPEGLYLTCRYSLEPFHVVPVGAAHEAAVTKMMSNQNELSQELSEATCVAFTQSVPVGAMDPNELPFQSFVALWREQVVGVMVLKRCTQEEMYALRANFDLAKFVNFDPDGDANYFKSDIAADPIEAPLAYRRDTMPGTSVKFAYLKPAWRNRLRLFMRDVLRASDAQIMLYPASATEAGTEEVFAPAIAELILAPPRRVPEFPLTDPAPEGTDTHPLMVLHFTSRRLLSDEKTQINARIVVVGSGTTGLAFIYSLLQLPYLNFSNIALISQDGMPQHPQQRPLLWAADTMEWSEREYMALKVGKKIRVIEGTMIDFDRADQYIYTDNATCEPYDHLVLTVGRQYAMPKELDKQGGKRGVFPLANSSVINSIGQHIHESEIYEDERSRAVIYGSNLDVYAVAACVTQLDLGPQRIVLVSPEDESYNAFGDDVIQRKVNELFDSLNIQRYVGHVLKRCEYDEDNSLASVFIAPRVDAAHGGESKQIDIDATMLIYAHEKDIDVQVLSALNKRSIVFDGRVIVENCYRTTDRNIYAAGPVAMFSRRFGPCDDFDMFNTLEVGRHLCHTILGFLGIEEFVNPDFSDEARSYVPKDDPLAAQLGTFREAPPDDLARRRPKPLPVYKDNVSRRVLLPTGLIFFTSYSIEYTQSTEPKDWTHLTSWSRETNPTSGDSQDSGIAANVMRGHDGEEKCYVRISVGRDGVIGSVAYLGRDARSIANLRSLVGVPESTLNLMYNYAETKDENGAPALDIPAYLESTWARAVFHDHFSALAARIKEKLTDNAEVAALREDMLRRVRASGERYLQPQDRAEALQRLTDANSEVRHLVELEVIKFLHDQKAFLPQHYYLPDMTAFLGPNAVPRHL